MIAVIFEAWPAEGQRDRYLALAKALKPELDIVDGFLTIERFESLVVPGKPLSLSFWRDDAAITKWRNRSAHRATQAKGRSGVFADYRLRVASVARDYGTSDRAQVSQDSRRAHEYSELWLRLAERVGFEPTVGLHPRRFSRPLP
jgi:heme-degrading monooxygenase HmoA